VAAIIWRNKSVLVQQRPNNTGFAGMWEFPGGKVESNEKIENTLTREIKEELDVNVLESKFWKTEKFIYEDKKLAVTIHFFNVTKIEGEPKEIEGQKLFWLRKGVDTTNMIAAITTMGANGYALPSVVDEDFIVWMRTAGLPTFKKLYRVIHQDLPKGSTLIIGTNNVFDVNSFNGQKSIVVSNTSWLGGKNSFLGWAYIVVGIIAVVVALGFFIKNVIKPRPLGDLTYFKWQSGH